MKVLPSSFSATFWASDLRSRLRASSCAFWVWKYSRFALVARRAFFLGRRKLRAKPAFTFTSSPIWPSFSTRSSRITCIVVLLLHDVGQERHETRALDGDGELALLSGGHGGDAARNDLAALGDEAHQELRILVVDLGRIGAGERAGLLAAKEGTALVATLAGSGAAHCAASSVV